MNYLFPLLCAQVHRQRVKTVIFFNIISSFWIMSLVPLQVKIGKFLKIT